MNAGLDRLAKTCNKIGQWERFARAGKFRMYPSKLRRRKFKRSGPFLNGLLQILVKDKDAESIANTLQVGDMGWEFIDSFDLFVQVLLFQVVRQVWVIVGGGQLVQRQQRLKQSSVSKQFSS